jgi:hypothetical protein
MANPLSDEGVSDRDFAAAVGIAMGETGSKRISKDEMAAVIDVAVNRLDRYDAQPNHYRADERSLAGIIEARGQFDASNRRGSRGGQQNYRAGVNAVMNGAPVPANMRARYDAAVKQAIGVLSKDGPLRGVARNADFFSSTAKKLSPKERAIHNKLGKNTGTKIGASTFYGPQHTKQYGARDAPVPARREADYSKFGQAGTPRENLSQPFATEDYSKYGQYGTPKESIPAAPYSPSGLNIGPDFTSPPSQARGPVENPYEFSNINTAAEAAPGSFAGYGPDAFGAVSAAPVDYGRTYPDITAGMYEGLAPTAPAPMSNEDFNAIFGNMPDDATGSVRNAQMSAAPPVNAARAGGPYDFSHMQSYAPAPDAATIPGDVTGYGPGGAFGSRAPSPGFDFADIVNNTAWSGSSPNLPAADAAVAGGRSTPAESSPDFNARMSDLLSSGLTGGLSPFQGTPLGVGAGIIDQGPYSSPIGYSTDRFSPANLGQAGPSRGIVDYDTKTITRDVPNPAWSDWSRNYGVGNALQDAWLAADEDRLPGVGRAPSAPSFGMSPPPPEPPRTTQVASTVRSPVYGDVPAARASPAQVTLTPDVWTPGLTQQAQNFSSVLGGLGGYGLQGVPGTFGTGFDLAGLGGGYGGYGAFGGGYDAGGGYGGYGGTAPGDAGYGSDARSGSSNMGAGNLYS